MKLRPATAFRVLAIVAVAGLYYWLSHVVTAADRPSTAGALLALGPYMAVALAMAWRARRRTLALTAYGDLRVTIIDALPPGRSPTVTRVFGPRRREQALEVLLLVRAC